MKSVKVVSLFLFCALIFGVFEIYAFGSAVSSSGQNEKNYSKQSNSAGGSVGASIGVGGSQQGVSTGDKNIPDADYAGKEYYNPFAAGKNKIDDDPIGAYTNKIDDDPIGMYGKQGSKSSENIINEHSGALGFLKFDGIIGRSKDEDHKGWLDIKGWNVTHKPNGDGILTISKYMDKSTPMIKRYHDGRSRIASVTLSTPLSASNTNNASKILFKGLVLVDRKISGTQSNGIEELIFSFREMQEIQ